jgi:surface antigen
MRGRTLLIAALTAPSLAGCGGFGFGDIAPPLGAGQPPATVAALPPAQSGVVAPAAVAPTPPPPPPIPTGAALGGVLGGSIGAALTDADRQAAWNAQLGALDSGQRRSWRGAHGVFGFVEPGAESGGGCRAYAQTIYVAGRPNHGQGVACKQPDGGWKMTS